MKRDPLELYFVILPNLEILVKMFSIVESFRLLCFPTWGSRASSLVSGDDHAIYLLAWIGFKFIAIWFLFIMWDKWHRIHFELWFRMKRWNKLMLRVAYHRLGRYEGWPHLKRILSATGLHNITRSTLLKLYSYLKGSIFSRVQMWLHAKVTYREFWQSYILWIVTVVVSD